MSYVEAGSLTQADCITLYHGEYHHLKKPTSLMQKKNIE